MKIRNIILITVSICLLTVGGVYSARTDYFGSANITSATIGTATTTTENVTTSNIGTGNITTGIVSALTATNSILYEIAATSYGKWKNVYYPSTSPTITSHSDNSQVGSIAWCVTQLSGAAGTIILPPRTTDWTFNSNYIVPTNVTIVAQQGGGQLAPAGGTTLTISNIQAGEWQVFDDTGTVVLKQSDIYATWFPGSDIGAKINAAIAAQVSGGSSRINVPSTSWCAQTYSTEIVLNKPRSLIFPSSGCTNPTYTGTEAAIKMAAGSDKSTITNFGVSLVGNGNSNVDGIYIYKASDTIWQGETFIDTPVRYGVYFESDGTGAYHNYFGGVLRIKSPGSDAILFDNQQSNNHPNVNHIEHLITQGTIPTLHAAVYFKKGYSNVINHLTINDVATGGWGVRQASGENYINNGHFDMNNTPALNIEDGHLTVQNRKHGVGIPEDTLYAPDGAWYVDVNNHNSMSFFSPKSIQSVFWTTTYPSIYATRNAGGSFPFDAAGHLVIQARSYAGDPGRIVFAGGDPPARWADFTSTGNLVMQREFRYNVVSRALTGSATLDLDTTAPISGNVYLLTGTATVTDITPVTSGRIAIFTGGGTASVTFVDGSGTIKLAGSSSNKVVGPNDTLILLCDGTSWNQLSYSDN